MNNSQSPIFTYEIFNPNKVTENFSYTIYWKTELAQRRDTCTENQNLESWISMNRLMKLLSSTELLILQGLTLIYIDFENSFNKEQYANIQLAIITHHWKCQSAKKELSIPPIWDCCGPTRDSFFTHRQIKHPPFSEIAVKTHSPFGPYLVDYFACVPPALKKGWMFYLLMGKK